MNNEVDVVIKTKADTSGVHEAKEATDKYGNSLEHLEEKADNSERSLIGTADIIGGTAAIMQGPGQQGMQSYIMGWADLGGGIAGVLPALKALSIETIKNAATQVTSAARTVAAWLAMKATAVASAAQMAVAWVISLGPIALVIGALTLITGALVTLWIKSQTFRGIVEGAWNAVWGAIKKVWNIVLDLIGLEVKLVEAWLKVVRFLTGPLVGAWNAVKRAIDGVVNSVKDFIQQTFFANQQGGQWLNRSSSGSAQGGRSGNRAQAGFAHGGITPGGRIQVGEGGTETLDLPAGMRIHTAADSRGWGGGGGAATITINVTGDDTEASKFVRKMIQNGVRLQGGGDVQRWLGYA